MSRLIMFLKKTLFAGLIPVLLMGLLVVSCPDPTVTDYSNTNKPIIEGLIGEWEEPYSTYTITGTTFNTGSDWGGYGGTIVNHRGDGINAGYITIRYTSNDYASEAIGSYYVIHYENLTASSMDISGAYDADDSTENGFTGKATQKEAERAYTTANGCFDIHTTVTRKVAVIGGPVNAHQPSITGQPQGGTWDIDDETEFTLTVTANSPDNGELSYQWYKDTIAIGTDNPLTLDSEDYEAGDTYYFYVVVTNTIANNDDGGTKTATVTSNTAAVTVIGGGVILIHSDEKMGKIGIDNEYPLSGKYLLMEDITLEDWVPAGPFTGQFNGGAKTITLKSFGTLSGNTAGIFGQITGTTDDKAQVKNLTIHVDDITYTFGSVLNIGMLAGTATHAVISDITLTGSFNMTLNANNTTSNLGGIAGTLTNATVENSTSNLTITASGFNDGNTNVGGGVGGIAGLAGAGAVISRCTNNGSIGGNSTNIGGIAGRTGGDTATGSAVIEFCRGIGDINSDTTYAATTAGGIIGRLGRGGIVRKSFASSNVSVTSTTNSQVAAGGIAGRMGGNGNNETYVNAIEDCYSTGNILAKATVTAAGTGGIYVGGIVGMTYTGGSGTTPIAGNVSRCYVTGTVTGERNMGTGAAGLQAGGIVGYAMSGALTIENCAALNTSISIIYSAATGGVQRVVSGTTGTKTNNIAWSGMSLTANIADAGEEPVTPTDIGSGGLDGENCDQRPAQTVYTTRGWDFTGTWEMTGGLPTLIGF